MTERRPDTIPDFDPDAVVDAVAPLLGLRGAEAYRAGIATNLRIAAGMAALVRAAGSNDLDEPASVFVPDAVARP